MGTVNFLKVETGRQAAFGTAVDPTTHIPIEGRYSDDQEDHEAPWDAGTWIKGQISTKVNDFATFNHQGSGIYEMLPMYHFAGYRFKAPTADGDAFVYEDNIDVGLAGSPAAYTHRFGAADEPIADGGGPAIQVRNGFCQTYTLTGGITQKVPTLRADWFGHGVDDNEDATTGEPKGYPFTSTGSIAKPGLMRSLGNIFQVKDATETGGVFTDMETTDCVIRNWALNVGFGTQPKWGADGGGPTYCGARYDDPVIELRLNARMNKDTWRYFRTKANKRTYQEVMFTVFDGADAASPDREFTIKMTGRWLNVPNPHDREDNEVVMQPVFRAQRYIAQATTPHLFGWKIKCLFEHE